MEAKKRRERLPIGAPFNYCWPGFLPEPLPYGGQKKARTITYWSAVPSKKKTRATLTDNN